MLKVIKMTMAMTSNRRSLTRIETIGRTVAKLRSENFAQREGQYSSARTCQLGKGFWQDNIITCAIRFPCASSTSELNELLCGRLVYCIVLTNLATSMVTGFEF
jgi:hypothetical protein